MTFDGGCKLMKCTDLKDGVCHYREDWCKYRPEDAPEDENLELYNCLLYLKRIIVCTKIK